jgi:hypothetical protein
MLKAISFLGFQVCPLSSLQANIYRLYITLDYPTILLMENPSSPYMGTYKYLIFLENENAINKIDKSLQLLK